MMLQRSLVGGEWRDEADYVGVLDHCEGFRFYSK